MQIKRSSQPSPAVRQLHATALVLMRLFDNVVEITRQHNDVRAHFNQVMVKANNARFAQHAENMGVDPLHEARALIEVRVWRL